MTPSRRASLALLLTVLVVAAACPVGAFFYARHHRDAARLALQRRDFAAAQEHLDRCQAVWPQTTETHLLAAQCARRRGDFDAAREHLLAIPDGGPLSQDAELESRLLRAEQGEQGAVEALLSTASEQPDAAQTPLVLEAAIKGGMKVLEPAHARRQTYGGGSAVPLMGRVMQAVEQWLRTRTDPADQVEGLVWRGRCHGLANDSVLKACEDFRQALWLDPSHFQARLLLAMALVQDSPREADAELMVLRQKYPENKEVRMAGAISRRGLGHPEQAIVLLDELLKSDPTNVQALVERGHCCLDLNQPEQAEPFLRRAHRQAPDVPAVNLALAACLRAARRFDEARPFQEHFERLTAPREDP